MKKLCALACSLLAFTAPSSAVGKLWIPWNMTMTTSAGGRFEKWEKPIPCRNGLLSTTLWVKNPRTVNPWTAGAYFDFTNGNELVRVGVTTGTLQTAYFYAFGTHTEKGGKSHGPAAKCGAHSGWAPC